MSSAVGVEHQRLLPESLEARLVGLFARVGGLLLLVAVAALWGSILTWSVTDPSLTHATGGEVRNALGKGGAIAAGLLLETLGLAASMALLPPMFWALDLILSERVDNVRAKIAGYPLALLATAAALTALPRPDAWPLEHGMGGILGDVLFNFSSGMLAPLLADRAGIVTGALFLAIVISLTGQVLGIDRRDFGKSRHQPGPQPFDTDPPRAPRVGRWFARANTATPTDQRDRVSLEPLITPQMYRAPQPTPSYRNPRPGHEPAPLPHAHPADAPMDEYAPAHTEHDDPEVDHSSRAIAERFAPAQSRGLPPSTPRHDLGTMRVVEADTLFGEPVPTASRMSQMQRPGPPAKAPERRAPAAYRPPLPALLKRTPTAKGGADVSQTVLRGTARLLEDVLADFGVKGEVRDIKPGPVVTLFELEPARGTKASRIVALSDDIARSMSSKSARVAVVPGRNAMGIELPNARRDQVGLRELLESQAFAQTDGALPIALGRDIAGEPVITDLARMPHLLVAGTTGSGKSVGVNAMILSILFRKTPEECRFLMIDPKMLELSVYNGIPHLLCPVVTEPQKAVGALNWVVSEMEERYKRMARLSVRNIEAFNARVRTAQKRGEALSRTVQTGFHPETGAPLYEREEISSEPMPYIVVVVDEFADLMITAGKDVETAVQRLAQKARAAGIHLIMATQRPSVDIITGTIKANFPTRISFKVASKIDSRTILNDMGAEQLLGQGDMLFAGGSGQAVRVHGPFVSDDEVETVAQHLRTQGEPRYIEGIGTEPTSNEGASPANEASGESLYDRAVALVLRDKKASTSYVQRRLSIGYNRAADLIERMEREGLISAPNATGRREILTADHAA